ncbi:MAG: PLD nuclease N-terminal domain-containing protein [Nanoarchaeota archaeon]
MVFGPFELIAFPFLVIIILLIVALALLITAFWIWMIIDCAKRNFRNDSEKIVWILVIVLATWIGALIYYFAIKLSNQKGISKK